MEFEDRRPAGGANALPREAEQLVARIEALLDQALALPRADGVDEAGFALRETGRRYLPDTIAAFESLPPALRDDAAKARLIDQLRLLERATAQRLTGLSESAARAQAANGAFLRARFGATDSLPEAPEQLETGDAPAALLVRRAIERLQAGAGADPQSIVETAAAQLAAAFPAIATVKRGGFFGRGPVESVSLDVPRRDDVLRYALGRSPHGGIEASVTRYLRGIRNKTLVVGVAEWTEGLIADLSAYVEGERGARESLTRLFRQR